MHDYCTSFLTDYVTSCLECIFSKRGGANKFGQKGPNLFVIHAKIFNYHFFLNLLTALIYQILKTNRNM